MKNYTATYATGRTNIFVSTASFDALNATAALAKARNLAPENAHVQEVAPTASLSEEINLCPKHYTAAGEPTIVDFADGPFDICERCTEDEDVLDAEIVSVKRADA